MEEVDKTKGIIIDLLDGTLYFQRYSPDTATEEPLTKREEVILFLDSRYEKIKLQLEQKEAKDRIRNINADQQFEEIEYIHKKTGRIYTVLNATTIVNSTNGENDGEEMIFYRNPVGEHFTREKVEFMEKFEKL